MRSKKITYPTELQSQTRSEVLKTKPNLSKDIQPKQTNRISTAETLQLQSSVFCISCLVAAHGAPISFEPKSDGREPIAGSQHARHVEPASIFCQELSSYTTNTVYETPFSFFCFFWYT